MVAPHPAACRNSQRAVSPANYYHTWLDEADVAVRIVYPATLRYIRPRSLMRVARAPTRPRR